MMRFDQFSEVVATTKEISSSILIQDMNILNFLTGYANHIAYLIYNQSPAIRHYVVKSDQCLPRW